MIFVVFKFCMIYVVSSVFFVNLIWLMFLKREGVNDSFDVVKLLGVLLFCCVVLSFLFYF